MSPLFTSPPQPVSTMQSSAAETMNPAAVQSAAAEKKRKGDDDLRMEKPNKKSKGKVQLSNDNEVIADAAAENLTVAGGGDVASGKVGVTASFLSDSRYVFVFINKFRFFLLMGFVYFP